MSRINPYAALVLIALAARALWLSLFVMSPIGGDEAFYIAMARNMLDHGVYGEGLTPGFYRPPLYSAFLWCTAFLPGDWRIATIIVQHLISIGVTLACYRLLRGWRPILAFLWAAAWLSSPFAVYSDMLVNQESLYTNLAMLAAALVFAALPRFGAREAIALALLLAAITWIRDAYLFLPLAFAIAILWTTAGRAWKHVALSLALFALAISPWMVRNANLPGGGLFMSKGIAGLSLYIGTWQRDGYWEAPWLRGQNLPDHAFDSPAQRPRLEHALQVRDDAVLKEEAVRRIKERPVQIAATWLSRSRSMWLGTRTDTVALRLERGSAPWTLFKVAMWGMNTLVLAFGLIGVALFGWRRSPLIVFAGVIGYVYTAYLPFLNIETRYSMPALPWLYFFALLALTALWQAWRQRSAGSALGFVRDLETRCAPGTGNP